MSVFALTGLKSLEWKGDEGDEMTQRIRLHTAFCLGLLLLFIGSRAAMAQDAPKELATQATSEDATPTQNTLEYTYEQNSIYYLTYDLAYDAMENLYKGTEYDKQTGIVNPTILMTEQDLNGDNMPEILAAPSETAEQTGKFCKKEFICPFYILQDRGDKIHVLGILWADTIDLGPDIENGYRTLKGLFDKETDSVLRNQTDTYVYDKAKDQYVKKQSKTIKAETKPQEKTKE